ncbi:extracellular calcium-sensing receptor-like [Protopterus annectens]|uniref:extracellular calcium-sensing receptor-like n=1 Tax=Protopterus annectens TaxID=7888 RepID=UPI001CFA24B0|nr:extracellular calcium-sensing receptor-like [Protopterus annectens]
MAAKISTPASCIMKKPKMEAFFREGDIVIGGIFVIRSKYVYPEASFKELPPSIVCSEFHVGYYRGVLGMVYAIDEINKNTHLLPNFTLGFSIFDSCYSENQAIEAALAFLSGIQKPVPNYNCNSASMVAGIIGELGSSLTIPVARTLGVYYVTQISPGAMHSTLSNKLQYPSFLRTVPSDKFQNYDLAQLIGYFGWTWVGILATDNDAGETGSQSIKNEILKTGRCIAFTEKIHVRYSTDKFSKLVELIRKSSVNAIIVHSSEVHIKPLLQAFYMRNLTGKVLLFTLIFPVTPELFTAETLLLLNGTLGLSPPLRDMPSFRDYLYHLHPSTSPSDILIKSYWEKIFTCIWPVDGRSVTELTNSSALCTGMEAFTQRSIPFIEMQDIIYSFHPYLATYAFANALHNMVSCKSKAGPFQNSSCPKIKKIQPWQVLYYVKNVHYKTDVTEEDLFFDVNGDAVTLYEVINMRILPNGTFRFVQVGRIDHRAPPGQELNINMKTIMWNEKYTQVPHSICSENCPLGYRKIVREGQPVCCFDCIICPNGEISNRSDSDNCLICPESEWSNDERVKCVPKMVEFLSFDEPLGISLATTAMFLLILTTIVLLTFIKYHGTPVVKANNRELSYLLLFGLMLCFLCSLIFIGYPIQVTCILRQTIFSIVFSISVSFVLAKTITVIIAFNATHPNSKLKRWVGSEIPAFIVTVSSLFQIVICAFWLWLSPPFPELKTTSVSKKIIVECNEGQRTFFYCSLGYLCLLAMVCFIAAFLARKLPDSFNEAKHITFSMLVFLSVWLSFIPAYLSTQGKYMVAVEIFAILSSTAGLLFCIFLGKCYIILLKPEQNTKKHLMGKGNVN